MNNPNVVNMTGQIFGRLTVLQRAENDKQGNAQWLCQCSCGNKKVVRGRALRTRKTLSCGCLLSESSKERMTKLLTKHGMASTKLYRVYSSMRERCEKPSCTEFHRYGGRGIAVCDEWRNDRNSFFEWALNNGYKEGLQIDRENNDGNYEPSNCRWVLPIDNGRNTSKCINVIATNCETGEEMLFRSINEAVEHTGICYCTIKRFLEGKPTRKYKFKFRKGEKRNGTENE